MNKTGKKLSIDEKIRLLEKRPCSCQVKLPPGIECKYRAFTKSELKPHEDAHARAIERNCKSKAREYEKIIKTDAAETIEVIEARIEVIEEFGVENTDETVHDDSHAIAIRNKCKLKVRDDLGDDAHTLSQLYENIEYLYEDPDDDHVSNQNYNKTRNKIIDETTIELSESLSESTRLELAQDKQNQLLNNTNALKNSSSAVQTIEEKNPVSCELTTTEQQLIDLKLDLDQVRKENYILKSQINIFVKEREENTKTIARLKRENKALQSRLNQWQLRSDLGSDNQQQNQQYVEQINKSITTEKITSDGSYKVTDDKAIEESSIQSNSLRNDARNDGEDRSIIKVTLQQQLAEFISLRPADNQSPVQLIKMNTQSSANTITIPQVDSTSLNNVETDYQVTTSTQHDQNDETISRNISTIDAPLEGSEDKLASKLAAESTLSTDMDTNQSGHDEVRVSNSSEINHLNTKDSNKSSIAIVLPDDYKSAMVSSTSALNTEKREDVFDIVFGYVLTQRLPASSSSQTATNQNENTNLSTNSVRNSLGNSAFGSPITAEGTSFVTASVTATQFVEIDPTDNDFNITNVKIDTTPQPPASPDSQSEKTEVSSSEEKLITLQDAILPQQKTPPILQESSESVSIEPIDISPMKKMPLYANYYAGEVPKEVISTPDFRLNFDNFDQDFNAMGMLVVMPAAPNFGSPENASKNVIHCMSPTLSQDGRNILRSKDCDSLGDSVLNLSALKPSKKVSTRKIIHCDTTSATVIATGSAASARASVTDPTRKVMDLLIAQVMEQKEQYTRQQSVAQESKKREIIPKYVKEPKPSRKCREKPEMESTSKPLIKKAKVNSTVVKPTVEPRVELNDVPDDFGYLLMEQLKEHILPQNILKIEKNTDASYFSCLERIMKEARTKSKEYIEGYSALIYLENAAEMLKC